MSNFLFSINVTIPIFLVMVIGYFLRRIGMLNENFVTVANKFNFKVTLPFLLFRDLSSVNIQEVFDLKYVLFCAIATSICFWSVYGLTKIFMKDKSMVGAFTQASFRSSAAVMGTGIYPEYLRAVNNGIPDDRSVRFLCTTYIPCLY